MVLADIGAFPNECTIKQPFQHLINHMAMVGSGDKKSEMQW
jgi:hypothetical protein